MQSYVSFYFLAFPENKPFEAAEGKIVSTSNHWDKTKNNEVSVTFTLSSAAAKVLSLYIIALHHCTQSFCFCFCFLSTIS